MSGVSTHVLDTSAGRPAAGVAVTLERLDSHFHERFRGLWKRVAEATTDADGRIKPLLAADRMQPGVYRITFVTGEYFRSRQQPTLYPEVTVTFSILPGEPGYHIPLLVNPFGYSTYRGT